MTPCKNSAHRPSATTRQPKKWAFHFTIITGLLLAFTGCRTSAPDPAQTTGTRSSTLQAHVWNCADGTAIQTRNLASPPAITLRIGSETRTLPQVRAASGVRYEDAMMQFWTKGNGATFQRKPGVASDCHEDRAQSLREDARVRGITFRGVGNEPGWLLEIGPENRVMFEDGYGSMRVVFQLLTPRNNAQLGVTIYENTSSAYRMKITLRQQICADTMSDETFTHTVDIEVEGAKRRGCGRALR
jgi:membrane-bound inhibitor of C-type lysozyme